MASDPAYKAFGAQVKQLQFKVRDAIDEPAHPSARSLRHLLDTLEDDVEQQKRPRNIEDRIETIQRLLSEARSQQYGFMSSDDADHFIREYEDLSHKLRSFSNY